MRAVICNFCKCTIDVNGGYYSIGPARHTDPVQDTLLFEVELPQSTKFLETATIDICPMCWEKFKAALAPLVRDRSLFGDIVALVEGGGDGTNKPS